MDTIEYGVDDIPPGLAKDALLVQDACNLSGVVHSLSRAMHAIWEVSNRKGLGTDYVNQHPIVAMYLDKLCQLNCHAMLENPRLTQSYWGLCEQAAKRDAAVKHP
jgi:hypothetical protein